MAGRQKSQHVDLDIKGRGTVTLILTAEDKDTIYLNGSWKLDRVQTEKAGDPLATEVLGTRESGKFERKKDQRVLDLKDAIVSLQGVDSDHGLAHGGRGVAAIGKLGRHPWTAH